MATGLSPLYGQVQFALLSEQRGLLLPTRPRQSVTPEDANRMQPLCGWRGPANRRYIDSSTVWSSGAIDHLLSDEVLSVGIVSVWVSLLAAL